MRGRWFQLDPARAMVSIMDLADAEAGRMFKTLLRCLIQGEHGVLPLADEMLAERQAYVDAKSRAGQQGMAKRWAKKKPRNEKRRNNNVIADYNQYITEQDNNSQNPYMGIPPTLAEVKAHALVIGLPEPEAIRFHEFYTGAGWKDRANVPCARTWRHKMAGWKLNSNRPPPQGAGDQRRVGAADYGDGTDPLLRAARERQRT